MRVPNDILPATDIDFEGLGDRLKALGNPVRLRLLHLCTKPHYLEELASHLKLTRPGVHKHVDKLVAIDVLQTRLGRRDSGPVTEYVLNRSRVFQLHAEFEALVRLVPSAVADAAPPTVESPPAAAPARAPDEDEPRLQLVRGLDEGRSFVLARRTGLAWRIGRSSNVDIRLDYDPFASSRHAEVRCDGSRYQILDAFSTNGTFRNYRRLEPGRETPLRSGDVVAVGRSVLVFQDPARS